MSEDKQDLLRNLPAMDRLLATDEAGELSNVCGQSLVKEVLREILDEERTRILDREEDPGVPCPTKEAFLSEARSRIDKLLAGSLGPVVNATGVVVHTNLGRAPLGKQVMQHITRVASGYSNLEYDLDKGERGHRDKHVEGMARRLLGCERSCVVNNNAAALVLVLNTLAEGKQTIVSRGELIEIGGSFRIPDIMRKSGSHLAEVGTTNKTRLRDYEEAINDQTAMILKVHPSNYRIVGFTESVDIADLVALGRSRGIPVVEDQGSGNLVSLEAFGISDEHGAGSSIEAGADLVLFSGDKLLGAPQAGIIAGRGEVVARCLANPLYRALRPDKMTLAGLEATLKLYLSGGAFNEVPVLKMVSMTRKELQSRAEKLIELAGCADALSMRLAEGGSRVGGGAVPDQELETVLVAIHPKGSSCVELESFLRSCKPPIIARIEEEQVLFDLRTVCEDDVLHIAKALAAYSGKKH